MQAIHTYAPTVVQLAHCAERIVHMPVHNLHLLIMCGRQLYLSHSTPFGSRYVFHMSVAVASAYAFRRGPTCGYCPTFSGTFTGTARGYKLIWTWMTLVTHSFPQKSSISIGKNYRALVTTQSNTSSFEKFTSSSYRNRSQVPLHLPR